MASFLIPVQKLNVEEVLASAGNGGAPLLPEGDYQAVCVKAEMKDTSARTGKYLALTHIITVGTYRDTEFVDRFNIVNPNEKAVKIAYEQYAKFCKAIGYNELQEDESKLRNRPFVMKLKTEKGTPWKDKDGVDREGKDKSVIAGYSAAPSGAIAQTAAAAQTNKMPWQM